MKRCQDCDRPMTGATHGSVKRCVDCGGPGLLAQRASCIHCGVEVFLSCHSRLGRSMCDDCRGAQHGKQPAVAQEGGSADRRCLGCGDAFRSWGTGNRMCSVCRPKEASPFEPEWGRSPLTADL